MPLNRRARWAWVALPALALAACSSSGHKPAPAAPTYAPSPAPSVGLAVAKQLSHPVHVGIIVSKSSHDGDGSDTFPLAEGAIVASYRLDLAAPQKVVLDVADDTGTSSGAVAAVKQLVADGDVGIVYASSGPHLAKGLAQAATDGVPVLLPYDTSASPKPGTLDWYVGPSSDQTISALKAGLAANNLSDTMVVASGSPDPGLTALASVGNVETVRFGTTQASDISAAVAKAAASTTIDSIVVDSTGAVDATLLEDMQATTVNLPVYFTGSALTPSFAQLLTQLHAATRGQYFAVGENATDTSGTPQMQAFLSGLRLAAGDTNLDGLLSSQSFSAFGAATADTRAHDAVVALVTAAAKAGTPDAAGVAAALPTLKLGAADGIAGPDLDFSQAAAVADSGVVLLQAQSQDPGTRSGITQAAVPLHWFSVPAGSS